MKCWICSSIAEGSGEHIPKASTMRDLFGVVTQSKPLYFSKGHNKNKKMQSINSKLIKYRVLCALCNSTLTQPFDLAWDRFWKYLNKNGTSLKTGTALRFCRIFGYDAKTQMLNLHLYAVKLFGCVAAEFSIPLDIKGMAESIQHMKPYPNVYLGIGKGIGKGLPKMAGPSDVEALCDDKGNCVFAVWFLTIGEWDFQFIYAVPGQKREGLKGSWNPMKTRRVSVKDFGG